MSSPGLPAVVTDKALTCERCAVLAGVCGARSGRRRRADRGGPSLLDLEDLEYRIGLRNEGATHAMLGGNLVVHVIVHGLPVVAELRQPRLELSTGSAVALSVRRQIFLKPFT
jgi:hypothetical protein